MLVKSGERTGRADPRAKRTRELILNAFAELIQEKGFDSITVQEIADRATVNRATFYAHFQDKYILLDESFAEWFRQVLHAKLRADAPFTAPNMQLLIQTVCEYLGDVHHHCAQSVGAQFDMLVERQVKLQLYAFLLGWLQIGNPKERGSLSGRELRATVTSWAIYGAALRWSQCEPRPPAAEFARQALPIIMSGFESEGFTQKTTLQSKTRA